MLNASENVILHTDPLAQINERQVGGKGWNLFRLCRLGFAVPPWCIVTSQVFENTIGEQKEIFTTILRSVDFTKQDSVELASTKIRKAILQSEIPESVVRDLMSVAERTFGSRTPLAVRSSAVGEDSADHSFAGQLDSFLNIRLDHLAETVKKVWASAYSVRALTYRHHKGINNAGIHAAVIIQQMVQSSTSGVLFSRDPENGKKECVISAGFGLGEGVVSNTVETDTYRIGWHTQKISCDVQIKESQVISGNSDNGGTKIKPISAALRSQQVLSNVQIQTLRDIAVRTEQRLGRPQDMEWAYDPQGRLSILQSRPIVFAGRAALSRSTCVWDNSNIVESYPGLTLPLTFSFIRSGYEYTFRNAALGMVAFKKEIKKKAELFKKMIGLMDGRVYYNLLSWYQMLSYLPGFARHKNSWDQMIGISHETKCAQNKLAPVNYICSLVIVLWKLVTVKRTARRFFAYFRPVYNQYKDIDLSAATADDLIAVYGALERKLCDKWYLTAYNDFDAMKYYDWLKRLCRRWGLEKQTSIHNNLLCREHGIESVAPVRSLVQLAGLFRTEQCYQKLFDQEDMFAVWETIQQEPIYRPLKDALEHHLQLFGDRGLEELKLEKPTFREDPAWLIGLIRNYYRLGLTVSEMEKHEENIRTEAEVTVKRLLRNPVKRLVFAYVLANARQAIANRENMRFARTRLYGIVRRIFRRMADLFAENDLIESPADLYYLTVEEIFDFVQGTAATQDFKCLVNLRKAEYVRFAAQTPADRIETVGIPYLNSLNGDRPHPGKDTQLTGIGCSSGLAEGNARVVSDPRSTNGDGDYILVAQSTDPGWVFLMVSSRGIIVERGSVLSHTAIIGRELGIPTIVGVKNATRLIPDGVRVSINGATGEIQWQ